MGRTDSGRETPQTGRWGLGFGLGQECLGRWASGSAAARTDKTGGPLAVTQGP